MSSIKINLNYFAASARLHGADGLGAVVRALAIDHARIKLQSADIEDLTDNTTGTPAALLVNLDLPAAAFDASVANGAAVADLNVLISEAENAMAVMAEAANTARVKLGLPLFTYAGTVAIANTVPALQSIVDAGVGVAAVDYQSGRAGLATVKAHFRKLAYGIDEVLVAVGGDKTPSALTGEFTDAYSLAAVTATTASADGTSAVSKADADDFFGDFADNVATLAAAWNAAMGQAAGVGALHVVAA